MKPLNEFFLHRHRTPWVLAGKGPSLDRWPEDLPKTAVLGLNHVCTRMECALTHFTDLRTLLNCTDTLLAQGGAVVVPWFPHVRFRPGRLSLEDLASDHALIDSLIHRGRLYSYNSTLAKQRHPRLPTQTVRYFSAVVGLDILARNGIKQVTAIGIDGGTEYASGFDTSTLLSNGQRDFNIQFAAMTKIAKAAGIVVRSLGGRSI